MLLNIYCWFAVVGSVIHCRNGFIAGVRLLVLELLVRLGRVNYSCDSAASMKSNQTHCLRKLMHTAASTCLITNQMRSNLSREPVSRHGRSCGSVLDQETQHRTRRFCHTCMLPLRRGAAGVVCVASTSRAPARLKPSPTSPGLLRRCLLMHADLAQAMQPDKLRGFAVDAAGYCLWPCASVSSQRPLGT